MNSLKQTFSATWRGGRTGKVIIGCGAILILCFFCFLLVYLYSLTPGMQASLHATATAQALSLAATQTEQAKPTNTVLPSSTPLPTQTTAPTSTPRPSDTPLPTQTIAPTRTPQPTATATRTPAPLVLSGNGDSVVNLNKGDGPVIAQINYNGGSNFVVWSDDPSGAHIDLLVNTIGAYKGTRPIDFLDGQQTTRFEVQASGAWTIRILPMSQMRRVVIPGTITGNGDDVIALDGGSPDLLKVDASHAARNFVIWMYGATRSLAVNKIAPYSGTVSADPDATILAVEATGAWSVQVTAK